MNRFHNLKLSHRFMLLIGFFLAAFVAYGAWSFSTLNELKVNGPLYQRIVQSKDLIADILPPPEYIIESHLVGLQLAAAGEKSEQDSLIKRLQTLKGEYDVRHEFWTREKLESRLDDIFLKQAHVPAAAFYAVAFNELVPAVQRQDKLTIAASAAKMSQAYESHRKAIDQVVEFANKRAETDEAQAKQRIQSASLGMLLILLAFAGCGLIATVAISRSVTRPLEEALKVAQRVASGDLTGGMQRIEARGSNELGQLVAALQRSVAQLNAMMSEIKAASDSVGAAAQEIAQGHTDLSTRTEEQASSLEETAASMEQMTATVSQNAENARKASQLATGASEVAVRGGQAVSTVVSTMTEISQSSKKIADIVGVIDGIAFQTNILALNAAVEAARAGDQGRGFAVVAAEVGTLAQRSAGAAKEIKNLIAESVAKVEAGSREVNRAGSTMTEIVDSVKRVNTLIAEISAASQEQSQGLSQVSDTVTQLEKVTQQNAAMVEQATAASASLEEQAAMLKRSVATFKLAESRQPAVLITALPGPNIH